MSRIVDITANKVSEDNVSLEQAKGIFSIGGEPNLEAIDGTADNDTAYITVDEFVFPGTDALPPISNSKGVAVAAVSVGTNGNIRIFDVTNAQVICESANFTDNIKGIIDLGACSNLPAGEAIFEVQMRNNVGGKNGDTIFYQSKLMFNRRNG